MMRFVEIATGIQVAVSGEENKLYERIAKAEEGPIRKRDLSEREQYLANQLVNKSMITRRRKNGEIYFRTTQD